MTRERFTAFSPEMGVNSRYDTRGGVNSLYCFRAQRRTAPGYLILHFNPRPMIRKSAPPRSASEHPRWNGALFFNPLILA